jgi:hypothetical protein
MVWGRLFPALAGVDHLRDVHPDRATDVLTEISA